MIEIVVPTIGRPTLRRLVERLVAFDVADRVLVVDDRRDRADASALDVDGLPGVAVVPGRAAGPAAARNAGWRAGRAEWVVFVDDDVEPDDLWGRRLVADLAGLDDDVAGSQGRVTVPQPAHRRPTDWERNVAGLEHGRWITADMAYRRSALAAVGGFDERFPRAYREDADIALRLCDAGWRLVRGDRHVLHPVRPADRWVSVRVQRGNADDTLMRAVHGRRWRTKAGIPKGRRPRHVATTAAAAAALAALAARRPRVALAAAGAWAAGTTELAWARIAPGPRTPDEVATMIATSAVLPFAATFHWLRGWVTLPARLTRPRAVPAAVLFDRDGTLVVDVPYNGDPERVAVAPGAHEALDRLRAAGIPTAVVSNQSGVARGLLTRRDVDAVNRRVEDILGPLGPWAVCPHGPDDGCACRKPRPGLVEEACRALGVRPRDAVVIGDIGADVEAALAAGARPILVPTPATRAAEIAAAPEVATDLVAAVDLLLGTPDTSPTPAAVSAGFREQGERHTR